jgi:predicted RNA binding protein YcfA (HicA-like mRNA interferase family)
VLFQLTERHIRVYNSIDAIGLDGAVRERDVVTRLTAAGWYQVSQNGGHKQFRHDDRPGTVTVHPGDLPLSVIKSIERQSGVRLR